MGYILLIILAFFLEGIITSIPLILACLLIVFVISKSNRVFLAAFVLGILIDVLKLHTLGISSIYYILFLFLVNLYQHKFEITTVPFVFISTFIGSIGYLVLISSSGIFEEAIVNAVLAVVVFKAAGKFQISNS